MARKRAHRNSIALREPNQAPQSRRGANTRPADQPAELHAAGTARRDHRARQHVRRGIDDHAHRDERQIVMRRRLRHGGAFHVDRRRAGTREMPRPCPQACRSHERW